MSKKSILENKVYLYLTEFFAGMAVMAVELGASRLLAPYFSSSQIVWTIIIGTIMIAMALGNVWGGRQADKDPNPDKLYFRILIAAVWIAAIPVLGKYIILGVSGLLVIAVNKNFLIIAAFISCMVVFVFPLFLLGTVTPSLVKYTVGSLDESGKTVGNLGACNTIGSIIGTFLPTFVTIPAVGTSITFLIFSGVLLLLATAYFICEKRRRTACIIAVILFIICSIFGNSSRFAFWENDLVYEGESVYNYLQVAENPRSVILSTNVLFGVQSIHMKEDDMTGMYYDYALAAPVLAGYNQKDDMDILVLGMGSGTYATQCEKYFPKATVEGVEIDEKITELAREYFELPQDVKVTTYDGRAYLQGIDQKYDVIMVDAYQDITIPFQMSSVEFFSEVADHLTEDGVMVVNMNMHTEEEGNINEYLTDTIGQVFDTAYTVDVAGSTNRELFAFAGDGTAPLAYLKDVAAQTETAGEKAKQPANLTPQQQSDFLAQMDRINQNLVLCEKGDYILTDDKAPVEVLGMEVIDSIINEELGYYKDIMDREGLSGVLKEFGI